MKAYSDIKSYDSRWELFENRQKDRFAGPQHGWSVFVGFKVFVNQDTMSEEDIETEGTLEIITVNHIVIVNAIDNHK